MSTPEKPIPPDENISPVHLAIVLPFYAVAVIVWSLRIWTRLWPRFTMTTTDYLITIAMACKTVSLAFYIVAIGHGLGRHNHYIGPHDTFMIHRYLLGVYMTGVVVSAFARISIAVLLLRFTTARAWRVAIWAIIAAQVGYVVVYEIVQLVQCKSVLMGEGGSRCMSKAMVLTSTYILMGLSILSDLICSALPMFLVWRMSRSAVEKTLVIVLMASCLLATACGGPKVYYMVVYDFRSSDFFWQLAPELLWCRLEETIIIIAACAPLLKGPVERLLGRFGLPTFGPTVRDINRISSGAYVMASGAWPDEGGRRVWSPPSDVEVGRHGAEGSVGKSDAKASTTTVEGGDKSSGKSDGEEGEVHVGGGSKT
ncbi:hypothetical protein QBC39DRAFT_415621 [Podospora conica]|nr:hypothetical protein QBC39DRAFT_415621 [Schizothecium conicum]